MMRAKLARPTKRGAECRSQSARLRPNAASTGRKVKTRKPSRFGARKPSALNVSRRERGVATTSQPQMASADCADLTDLWDRQPQFLLPASCSLLPHLRAFFQLLGFGRIVERVHLLAPEDRHDELVPIEAGQVGGDDVLVYLRVQPLQLVLRKLEL